MEEQRLNQLAVQAWIYGYPLVLMDTSRRVMAGERLNTFDHRRAFPDASYTDVVTPNADTLYSSAWLDLRAEPMVLSVPATGGRYFMMPMLSAWTDVLASPGSRTTGPGPGAFAVCGPGWDGTLPVGVERIDSPTALVWLIGRTSTAGPQDYESVHALQDRYRLAPLSRYTGSTPPPVAPPLPIATAAGAPADQVQAMTGEQFFSRLTELMIDNPPSAADAPALAAFAQLGLIPGAPWTPDSLSPQVRAAIAAAPAAGMAALKQAHAAEQADTVNGWSWPRGLGAYGTDYGRRALVANVGLGANLDADALYPNAYRDGEGQPLSGEHRYLLRFEAGELPPVNGFWSLSLYNHKQAFADNPIDRYAIGDRDHLLHGADGSLTLYIQHDEPTGDRKANWLPAPAEPFNLYLRLFWPREEAEDGTWQIPPVHRTE